MKGLIDLGRRPKQAPAGDTRAYCARNRQTPFREHGFSPGEPAWRKVGGGLIAVTDGTARQYVGPGLVFAIERGPDGEP